MLLVATMGFFVARSYRDKGEPPLAPTTVNPQYVQPGSVMSSDNAVRCLAPVASSPNYAGVGPGLGSVDHDHEYGGGGADQGDQPVYADVADAEYAVPTAEEAVYLAPVVAAGTDAAYNAVPPANQALYDTADDCAGNTDGDTANAGEPQYAENPGGYAEGQQGQPLYATADAVAAYAEPSDASRTLHRFSSLPHYDRDGPPFRNANLGPPPPPPAALHPPPPPP